MPINVNGILRETYAEKIARLKLEHAYRHSKGYKEALESDPGFEIPIGEQDLLQSADIVQGDAWHDQAAQLIPAMRITVSDPTYPYVSNLQEYIDELDQLISQKEYSLGIITSASHYAAPSGSDTFSLIGQTFTYGSWGSVTWPTLGLEWDGQSFKTNREGRIYQVEFTIIGWPNPATGIALEVWSENFGVGTLIGRGFGGFPGSTQNTPGTVVIPISSISGNVEDLLIYPNRTYYIRFVPQGPLTIWRDSILTYNDGEPYQTHSDWNFTVKIIPTATIYPTDFRGDTLLVNTYSGKTIEQAINEGAATTASGVFYSNAISGLPANDVQNAIDTLTIGGINPNVAAIVRDTYPIPVTNIIEDTHIQGNLVVDKDVELGNISSDKVIINGTVQTNSLLLTRLVESNAQYTEYEYNSNNDIVQETVYTDNSKIEIISNTIYSYDLNNNISQAVKYLYDNIYPYSVLKVIQEDFTYDSNYNIISVNRTVY